MTSKHEPLVSIVILNYNGKRYIKNCIESIENQRYNNIELVFVDNASTDDSLVGLKQHYPKIKLVINNQNLGSARGNNIGANSSKGKYLFFLNIDTKLDRDCIYNLVKTYKSDSRIGICACRELSYNGKIEWNCGIGVDIFGYSLQGVPKRVFHASSSSLFIKKELFEKLNGFDESYFMYKDDIDLCWRAQLLDYKVIGTPSAIVFHEWGGVSLSKSGKKLGSGTIKKESLSEKEKYILNTKKRYHGEVNSIKNILKNYSLFTLLWILPFYIIINFFEMIFFLIMGKPKAISDVYIKSYFHICKSLKHLFKSRKAIQKQRVVSDFEILKRMQKTIGKFSSLKLVGMPKIE